MNGCPVLVAYGRWGLGPPKGLRRGRLEGESEGTETKPRAASNVKNKGYIVLGVLNAGNNCMYR